MSAPPFTCPRCGRVSYHPEDVRQRYCGACHVWHVDVADAPAVQDAVDALVEAALPDPAAMTHAEALEELGRRYRVRVAVMLTHGERHVTMDGATLAESGAEAVRAGADLVGVMLERLRRRLEDDAT